VRGRIASVVIVATLVAGCGHTHPYGQVDGSFRLPGRPVADLQRGGLNFLPAGGSTHRHRGIMGFFSRKRAGHGHLARVSADGSYSVSLSPGTYTVIGGLSGHPGGPAAESCAGAMNVVVIAKRTTRADFVCHGTPVNTPTP